MINVTEIMKRGAENRKLPPWVNMRHAWMVNDGLRDKDLEYPENVVQIKNLDYKKRLDAEQFAAILESFTSERIPTTTYAFSFVGTKLSSSPL
jgi:hypothetical protein